MFVCIVGLRFVLSVRVIVSVLFVFIMVGFMIVMVV